MFLYESKIVLWKQFHSFSNVKLFDHKMAELKIILIKNYIHFNNSNFELNKFMTESILFHTIWNEEGMKG